MAGSAKEQPPPQRVVVFVDEANVFMDARRAFGMNDPKIPGRFNPMRFGRLLVDREPLGEHGPRELYEVRVYTGTPSSEKDSESYAAHRRQVAAWRRDGATVIARPLRYPREWPKERAQQKGVDVHLALDIVVMAIRGEYDVAIVASADTDLRPALEACRRLPEGCPVLEVAAWRAEGGYANRLTVPKAHLWCHYLDRGDYLTVADYTNYNAK